MALIALAAALLAGCEDCGRSSGPTDASAPEEIAPALGALCDLVDRCDDLMPIASRSRAECIDILYWLLTCRLVEEGGELVGTERVDLGLDAGEARECADFIAGLDCEDLDCLGDGSCPEGAACLGLFAAFGGGDDDGGRHGEGEECWAWGDDCAAGLYCRDERYDEEVDVVVCAACEPLLGEGETCQLYSGSSGCGAGLHCQQDPETGAGRCEALRADGVECSAPEQCESGFCGDGACSSGGREGDPCETRAGCRWEEELACIAGACASPLEMGASCGDASECRSWTCDPVDGRCGLADGSSCFDSPTCRSGFCDRAARDCAQPRANGEACTAEAPEGCESGYCDPASSFCAPAPPPLPEGSACESAARCEEGLACDTVCYMPCDPDGSCPEGRYCGYSGRTGCLPLGDHGAGCESDEECLSGFCSDAELCAERPAIGDPCTGYMDCFPAGYCSSGVCVARRGPGESCESLDSCLQPYLCLEGRCTLISLSCEPAAVGQQCTYLRFCDERSYCGTSLRCVARVGRGQQCMGIPGECAAGLFCSFSGEAMTCEPGASEGDPCGDAMPCVDGSTCLGEVCTAIEPGDPCTWSEDCPAGSFCNDRSEQCEPLREEGEECDEYDAPCAADLFCSSESYPEVCAQPHGPGEECDRYREPCRPELYCDTDEYPNTCVARPALGAACDSDTGCAPGARCETSYGGTCVARVDEGEPCDTISWDPLGSSCLQGLFCSYLDGSYVCSAPRELGESCDSGAECASGFCASNFGRCVAEGECVMPE